MCVQSFQPEKTSKVEDKNQNKQGMNSSAEKETGEEKDIFQSLLITILES